MPETEGSFNESETSEDSSKKGPTKDEQRHFLLKVLLPKVKWHKLNWKVANEAEWCTRRWRSSRRPART